MFNIDTSMSYRVMQIDDRPTYSVQWKKWWWPIYFTCGGLVKLDGGLVVSRGNGVFGDIDSAADYARYHARYNTTFKPKVVRSLDV